MKISRPKIASVLTAVAALACSVLLLGPSASAQVGTPGQAISDQAFTSNTQGPTKCSLFGPGIGIEGHNVRVDQLCLTNVYTPWSLGDDGATIISSRPLLVGLSYSWWTIPQTGSVCDWWVDFNVYRTIAGPGQQTGLIDHSQGTESPSCPISGHGTRYKSGLNPWLPLQLQPGDQVCVTMWRRGSGVNNIIRVAGACQYVTSGGVS